MPNNLIKFRNTKNRLHSLLKRVILEHQLETVYMPDVLSRLDDKLFVSFRKNGANKQLSKLYVRLENNNSWTDLML